MPRSIKPKMSNDELSSFDGSIAEVYYDEGCLSLETTYFDDMSGLAYTILLDEKDLEDMLNFLRANKETK